MRTAPLGMHRSQESAPSSPPSPLRRRQVLSSPQCPAEESGHLFASDVVVRAEQAVGGRVAPTSHPGRANQQMSSSNTLEPSTSVKSCSHSPMCGGGGSFPIHDAEVAGTGIGRVEAFLGVEDDETAIAGNRRLVEVAAAGSGGGAPIVVHRDHLHPCRPGGH